MVLVPGTELGLVAAVPVICPTVQTQVSVIVPKKEGDQAYEKPRTTSEGGSPASTRFVLLSGETLTQ